MTAKPDSIDCLPMPQRQLLALIRLALGQPVDPCLTAGDIDWHAIFSEARKQALNGITFAGIEKLPHGASNPDTILLMEWIGNAEFIKTRNLELNEKVLELAEKLHAAGFEGAVMKGQGIAQLYPIPELRTPGDIDIWIPNRSRKEILRHLRSTSKSQYMVYHNAEYPIFDDVSVEVHFTPSWFWNPIRNKRFQAFCNECADECLANKTVLGDGEISTPTLRFNRVFILQHIYRHLFGEGIGLRQLLDYYFVLLRSYENDSIYQWIQEKRDSFNIIKQLGMGHFCAAVMWIMKEAFAIPDDCLLCPPNEKEGLFLLREIMQGGNFGQYDERNRNKGKSAWGRFLHHVKRDMRYVASYPGEVLWVPFWKIWHFYWRKQF